MPLICQYNGCDQEGAPVPDDVITDQFTCICPRHLQLLRQVGELNVKLGVVVITQRGEKLLLTETRLTYCLFKKLEDGSTNDVSVLLEEYDRQLSEQLKRVRGIKKLLNKASSGGAAAAATQTTTTTT